MKKYLLLLGLGALVSATSCDIERLSPSNIATDQITSNPDNYMESLMNGMYAQLKTWSDPMHRCGEYAGDNMVIRGNSTDAFFEFISYSRTPQNYRLQNFWDYGYKAIAQASNIINMFEEGKNSDIDQYLGECYYVRGMLYFYFVRAYGRPYYQAPSKNLGVPIVNGTPDNIMDNLFLEDRATVEDTYKQIINDLKKAESLMNSDRGAYFASKGAAQAMLSRVYLYMSGTFDKVNTEYANLAVEYSTKVIESGDYQLLSRDEFMHYNERLPENNPETIFCVRRVASEFSGYDHYYGVGGMYANIGGMGWGEMFASEKYIALLNETGRNDWREESYYLYDARAAFIEPTYEPSKGDYFRFVYTGADGKKNYAQLPATKSGDLYTSCAEADGSKTYALTPINADQDTYSIDYNGETCEGMIDYFITLNRANPQFYIVKCSREGEDSHLHSPIISRLGEIYLNRAEAYAKLGQYGKALTDLNIIRNRSIIDGGYESLDDTNAEARIDKERTLELAYQAERSYDVYRNGRSLTRLYPGPHNQLEEVQPNDYRVVYYIPQNAINAYPGVLTQNPTSNAGVITE